MEKDGASRKPFEEIKGRLDALAAEMRANLEEVQGVFDALKAHLEKTAASQGTTEERLSDVELQVNLLTRLLTTLCLERFGLRLSELRKLIRRIEKETMEDSEIAHLEGLYSLDPKDPHKKHPPDKPEEKT